MNEKEIIQYLERAHYTDVKQTDGIYSAVNIFGEKRVFRFTQMIKNPVAFYVIRASNVGFVDFEYVTDIKILGLDFKETDENGNLKYVVKVIDYFLDITEEQERIIRNTYDDMVYKK